ncbi:MAG: tRNA (adenosine(37)-N6)-dimethylallyltransferase MiaA [Lachnospiraceae bacterium]|nr:tRNA (adenosine(37)-N6)-dimethylallyltransferase MiaA [Lachnospiraceae bacterium]
MGNQTEELNKLVVITGTTASGKSDIAVELAGVFSAEIVSADSRQVFEGLNLGSGKITPEEMKGVKHHLLDVAKPNDFFSLADFMDHSYKAIDGILSGGGRPFLVGGTGLYINAIVDGYCLQEGSPDLKLRKEIEQKSLSELLDLIEQKAPKELERIDIKNKRRVERAAEKILGGKVGERPLKPRYETRVIGVTWPREVLYERIGIRLDKRLEAGMIEEVSRLREKGVKDEFLYKLGLEYRYILMYLRGEFDSYEAFYNKLFMEIRHLAKEQMTWFRKRKDIYWIDMEGDPFKEATGLIEEFYNR